MELWLSILLIILAPAIGCLIHGEDRWVKARMQNRQGPPIIQPFYDLLKLFEKRIFIVHSYHALLSVAHLVVMWISVAILLLGGDILMAIFFHLLATLLLVIAGYSVRSVFSNIGSTRELVASLTYEPVFVLSAICLFVVTGTFEAGKIWQIQATPLYSLPLVFIAMIVAIPAKLKKSPFDIADAHQEIVGGIEIEYSGFFKGVLYISKWLDYVYVYAFMLLFAGCNYWLMLAISVVVFLFLAALDNATARVTYRSMNRVTLPIVIPLVILNLAWLAFR